MRFSPVLAALLCFTTWMSVVHATHAPLSNCCIGWSDTTASPRRIANYTIQTEAACDNAVNAVVFHRNRGSRICSNPDSDWAKETILKVDERKKQKRALQEKGQNEEGLPRDVTPTVSLPLKNTPQKKGRKERKRQKKMSRGGRRGQKKSV